MWVTHARGEGWCSIRTFDGAEGRWKLSNLGKQYFKRNGGLPEVVLRIPCIFETQKTTERAVRHLGWFPYELLDEALHMRLLRLYIHCARGGRPLPPVVDV